MAGEIGKKASNTFEQQGGAKEKNIKPTKSINDLKEKAERKKAAELVSEKTKGPKQKVEKAVKGKEYKESDESKEKLKPRTRSEIIKAQANIKADELEGIDDDAAENLHDLEKQKEEGKLSQEEFEKSRKKIIDGLDDKTLDGVIKYRIDDLGKDTIITDKDGEKIKTSVYEGLKIKDEKLAGILKNFEVKGDKENKFAKELLATYGKDKLKAIGPLLEELKKQGNKIPDNLEELDKLIVKKLAEKEKARLAKEDPDKVPEQATLEKAAKEMMSNASAGTVSHAVGDTGSPGKNIDFPPGNATANDAELTKAIESLPDGKAKKMLRIAQKYLHKNEKTNRTELKAFLGFDPASTPWCKGFVNAVCKRAGVHLNSVGSLAARSGEQDGRKLKIPGEKPKPGDLVIVSRKGTTTSGTPGGHIGIFIGMSASGRPIMIGGNQGKGEVSVKEEKRPIVSINRVVPDGDQEMKNSGEQK